MSAKLPCTISSLAVKSQNRRPTSLGVLVNGIKIHEVTGVASHTHDLDSKDVAINLPIDATISIQVRYRESVDGKAAVSLKEKIDMWEVITLGDVYRKSLEGNLGTLQLEIKLAKQSLPTRESFEEDGDAEELLTMALIRAAIRDLQVQSLSNISPHLTDIVYVILVSLWTILKNVYRNPVEWVKQDKTDDYEKQCVDPFHPRYIAPYDMLVHIRSQTDFLVSCLARTKKKPYITCLTEIARGLLVGIVRDAALAYRHACVYYSAIYTTIGEIASSDYSERHYDLLYHRVRLLLLIKKDPATIPHPMRQKESQHAFLTFVFAKALKEIRLGPDWKWSSYTVSLMALRNDLAQDLMFLLGLQIDSTQPGENKERNYLRRLLSHIASASDEMPRKLLEIDEEFIDIDDTADNGQKILIGRGSYGEVFAGFYSGGSDLKLESVALKYIWFEHIGSSNERSNVRQNVLLEIVQWCKLHHENILPLIGISFKFETLTLVSPKMPYGSVRAYLRSLEEEQSYAGPLWSRSNWFINDVAKGLHYLHREGIIHGDLRGDNVLVNKECVGVISDFGLSLFVDGHSGNYNSRRAGNRLWTAPEIIDTQTGLRQRPTIPSDIYSFAMVCIELYMLGAPVTLGQSRPSRPHNPGKLPTDQGVMRDGLWTLVQECWDQDPKRRPTTEAMITRLEVSNRPPPVTSDTASV